MCSIRRPAIALPASDRRSTDPDELHPRSARSSDRRPAPAIGRPGPAGTDAIRSTARQPRYRLDTRPAQTLDRGPRAPHAARLAPRPSSSATSPAARTGA